MIGVMLDGLANQGRALTPDVKAVLCDIAGLKNMSDMEAARTLATLNAYR